VSSEARQAHHYAIARLAIDFVSGPRGLASALRTGLLEHPYSTPSLPLDIGHADSIPGHIRRAVILRDQHCAWPGGCDRPASASDVHHIRHKSDGGETSVQNCGLFCEFHHETCIHRWGWQVTLHPDGTMEARSPDGRRVLRSHAPPAAA
jgi:HNH endonuclease